MGRKRKINKHLPQRMYQDTKSGTFYYKSKDGVNHPLGKIYTDALVKYGVLAEPSTIQPSNERYTMGLHIEKYMREVSPTKAKTTHESEIPRARRLNACFGHIPVTAVTRRHVCDYMQARLKNVGASANRELSLLSDMFNFAFTIGFDVTNPTKNVPRFKEKSLKDTLKDTRYIDDIPLTTMYYHSHEWMQHYIELKVLTGMRSSGLLNITLDAITEDGLYIKDPGKKSRPMIYEWNDELRTLVAKIKAYSIEKNSNFFFPNNDGSQRKPASLRSAWKRAKKKAIENGLSKDFPPERYIRNKAVTDAEDIREASMIVGHTDVKTTRDNYAMLGTKVSTFDKSMSDILSGNKVKN